MNNNASRPGASEESFVTPPAFSFKGRDLFANLRKRLGAAEGRMLSLAEIGAIMGKPTSTTHFWLEFYEHPHVIGFMALLERLSSENRHAFIDAHCRVLPSLADPRIGRMSGELTRLLNKKTGLTMISGSSDSVHSYLISAFGHAWSKMPNKRSLPAGIDLHLPNDFVPVIGIRYLEHSLSSKQVADLVSAIWPRILTAKAPLLLFNGLWSRLPELRGDIQRLTERKHVILADKELAGFRELERFKATQHLVEVAGDFQKIRIL